MYLKRMNERIGKLSEQKTSYIQQVTSMLNSVVEECVNAPHEDEEQVEENDSTSNNDNTTPLISSRSSSVFQAASTLGYIPTVPGIGDTQPLNSGDEQLGRVLSGIASFLSTDTNRVFFCSIQTNASSAVASLLDKLLTTFNQPYFVSNVSTFAPLVSLSSPLS